MQCDVISLEYNITNLKQLNSKIVHMYNLKAYNAYLKKYIIDENDPLFN